MKFYLLGEETKLEIEVLCRNHPDCTDFWDGNWVKSKVNIEIPGYLVDFNADLRTDEIRDFLNELKEMNKHLKGTATLSNLDSYLYFKCVMNKTGGVFWSIETCYPAGYGAVLNFEFEADQSYLEKLIRELDDILTAFPVIGKP